MPAGSEGVWVWVVYDPQQRVEGASLNGAGAAIHDMLARGVTGEAIFVSDGLFRLWMQDNTLNRYEYARYTLQRLPLATPEMLRELAQLREWREKADVRADAREKALCAQCSVAVEEAEAEAIAEYESEVMAERARVEAVAARAAGGG